MSEVNKYQNGKIYKIEPINGEEGDIYIGSTTQKYLSSRMNQHRGDYKKKIKFCNCHSLFDKYGIENCNIILLEMVNVNNKMELHQREAYYIKLLKCINKNIPLRTIKEWNEDNKQYIKEYKKIYQEVNKDKIKEYDKQRQHQVIFCDCCKKNISKRKNISHYKSQKHIKNMEQLI
jgi:hypothetical protein